MLDPRINNSNINKIGENNGKTSANEGVWADKSETEAYAQRVAKLKQSLGYGSNFETNESGLMFLDAVETESTKAYKGYAKVKNFLDSLGGQKAFIQDLKDGAYTRGEVESLMKEAGITKTDLRNFKAKNTEHKNIAKMFGLQ